MPVAGPRSPLRRHALKAAALAVVGAVAAGPWLLDSPSDASTPAATPGRIAGTSCHETALRWGVTNRSDVRQQQDRFERSGRPVPNPGAYATPLDPVASLHAAAHDMVVLYHRADAGARLAALHTRAQTVRVPVVLSPRDQPEALVVVRDGAELRCDTADDADLAAAWRFAAAPFVVPGD